MFCQKLSQNRQFRIQAKKDNYFTLFNIALDPQSNVQQASLFLIQTCGRQHQYEIRKQILIAQLSRVGSGQRSLNLCLQFGFQQPVLLLPKAGSVHIIGGYKKINSGQHSNVCAKQNIQSTISTQVSQRAFQQKTEKQHSKLLQSSRQQRSDRKNKSVQAQVPRNQQQKNQTNQLRRSSRARPPVSKLSQVKVSSKSLKRQNEALKNMAKYFQCDLDQDQDDSFSEQNESDNDEEDDDNEDEDDDNQQKNQQIEQMKAKKLPQNNRKTRIRQKQKQKSMQDEKKSSKSNYSVQKNQSQTVNMQSEHFSIPTKNPYV